MSALFFLAAAGFAAAAIVMGRALNRDLVEYAAQLEAEATR